MIGKSEKIVRKSASAGFTELTCSVAGACGLKKCPSCACGTTSLTVGVTLGATGEVQYSYDNSVTLYAAELSFTCNSCTEVQPPPPPPPPSDEPYTPAGPPASPLLLDFGQPGFQLTGLSNGVSFDLTGDGVAERVSWTTGEDAFLVLDRNGNGAIDGALEVFGDRTEQPASSEPNGFLALAVFDGIDEGGNADARMTPSDPIFSSLRLWFDRNHDGTSQVDELETLESRGLAWIELGYVESRRVDRWGNQFRYLAWYKGEPRQRKMMQDVFFVVGPSASAP